MVPDWAAGLSRPWTYSEIIEDLNRKTHRLIKVHLHRAEGLPRTDGLFNKIDPYVIVNYGPFVYQTSVIHSGGSNPRFEKTLYFMDVGHDNINIILYDHDYFRDDDDFLGRISLTIPPPSPSGYKDYCNPQSPVNPIVKVCPLMTSDGTEQMKSASITLSVERICGAWPKPLLKYLCHRKKMAGLLKAFETGKLKRHKAWEIKLQFVFEIFGLDRQKWNDKYDKAQQIFDENSKGSRVLRSVISSVQSSLYSKSMFDSEMGTIEGGYDLMSHLKFGVSKDGKPRCYTYVIVGSSLFFSETGKGLVADFVSKHAIHAGASESVVYSGEFHISKDSTGDHVLVFDNNSGTYSPATEDLPKVRHLLFRNFPDANIECLSHEDPKLEEFKRTAGLLE